MKKLVSVMAFCVIFVPLFAQSLDTMKSEVLKAIQFPQDSKESFPTPHINEINIGKGINHYIREDNKRCGYFCTNLELVDNVPKEWVCLDYIYTCDLPTFRISLHMTKSDAEEGIIFGAYTFLLGNVLVSASKCIKWNYEYWDKPPEEGTDPKHRTLPPRCLEWSEPEYVPDFDTDWYGCGIKAAQNVLRYFGVIMPQNKIKEYIKTIDIPFSRQIATFPEWLRDGLQNILNEQANLRIKVNLQENIGGQVNPNILKGGYPIIALVDNGSHWIVVAGYNKHWIIGNLTGTIPPQDGFFVLDNWNSVWRDSDLINLSFGIGPASWASIISTISPIPSYKSGTIITFTKKL